MAETSNLITFTRDEFTASLRVLLVGFSEWVEQILVIDVIPRTVHSMAANPRPDLSKPLSAGRLIEESAFLSRMRQVYDFVTTGIWDTGSLEEFGHELEAYQQLCRLELESHGGASLAPSIDPQRLPSPQQMCGLVLEHAVARGSLLRGESLTLSEVAMLAGLAEKTIRMAANPKNPDRLVTYKDGHNTYVTADEALRWLSDRPGFRPTRMADDARTVRAYGSVDSLARHCKQLRADAGLTLPELFKQLAWKKPLQTTYRQLEEAAADLDPRPLGIPQLSKLGQALGVSDVRQFTKQAALVLAPLAIERECAASAT